MIKKLVRVSALGLMAAALTMLPAQVSAQTTTTNTPPATPPRRGGHPFHGKLAAVDTTGKTIKVGESTYQITSETRIRKAGKPATLEDATVGEEVSGFVILQDGNEVARTLTIGPPPPRKKKAPPMMTNSPPANPPAATDSK